METLKEICVINITSGDWTNYLKLLIDWIFFNYLHYYNKIEEELLLTKLVNHQCVWVTNWSWKCVKVQVWLSFLGNKWICNDWWQPSWTAIQARLSSPTCSHAFLCWNPKTGTTFFCSSDSFASCFSYSKTSIL